MGSSTTTTSEKTEVEPTEEEKELNKLLLERTRATQEGQIQTQESGLNLINQLLTGGELPGNLSGLAGGISPEVTNRLVQESLGDVRTSLQSQGLFDSGIRAELETETAANIRQRSEQFNIQNIQQLLNLAVGGQAQIQQPLLQQQGQLSQNLAGLRTVTGSGSTTTPFLQTEFAGGFGQGIGSAFGTALGGCWVASELFGGWFEPKTIASRNYVNNIAPKWFKNLYLKYGEKFAKFIKGKRIIKFILRPIFEIFSRIGGYSG